MKTKFVEIIDDFLDKSYFDYIANKVMCDDTFPWYYSDDSTYHSSKKFSINGDEKFTQGFSNLLINNDKSTCPLGDLIYPFALKVKSYLGAREVLRVRADMCMQNPEGATHGPHVDYPGQFHYSAILYINQTDGNTHIFNERDSGTQVDGDNINSFTIKESIEPKPNRLVVFDGRYIHSGCSPRDHKCRKLLNSNYK
jgi:hypothetical protein|tara:strand:+ start:6597 stop:7187 length:591 start_codon:yes stop_codon:yes gene_type:complete